MPAPRFADIEAAIDPDWMARILREMILIRSENPFDDPPGEGTREQEMADYLAGHLSDLGMTVEMQAVRPGRPNVFGVLRGSADRSRLMLAGHMDTARTTGYPEAYEVRVADGKMYGRGACDMKAALAAYLGAARALRATGTRLAGTLILCGIVDEEYQMLGSKAIGRGGRMADQGIIGEPTNLKVCPANKGRVSTKIVTRGRAAHSSVPEKGVNAIAAMARVIQAFEDYNRELLGRPPHPLCGNGRFTPGVIHGGVQVNMVPDRCELEVDRRTLPGETRESVYAELQARIDRAGRGRPRFQERDHGADLADRTERHRPGGAGRERAARGPRRAHRPRPGRRGLRGRIRRPLHGVPHRDLRAGVDRPGPHHLRVCGPP